MKNQFITALLLGLFLLTICNCKNPTDAKSTALDQGQLLANFQTPPNEARPRVWWHWMNGNITKAGIQKDLDWMHQVGIGGFHNFDANQFTPDVVENKLVFMSEDWKDAFQFTTKKAQELGFEMAIAGSPGWSVTGGPWVPKEDGMKKYVWTETQVKGGTTFNAPLPKPADNMGHFQNVAIDTESFLDGYIGEQFNYYKDAFVIAYQLPEGEKSVSELKPKVSSSNGQFTIAALTDGDLHKSTYLSPQKVGEDMWLQYEFDSPQTFKAFSVVGANTSPLATFEGNPENRTLKVSDDGINFKAIATVPGTTVPHNTVGFQATTAKYWRMTWKTIPPPFNPFKLMAGFPPDTEPEGIHLAEFVLYNTDRIDQIEDKAGFAPWKEDTPSFRAVSDNAILQKNIMDLTEKMQSDGTLNWEVPQGNWAVIRFGYSLTGRQNHPASPEATGLEVDKLDEEAVRRYINAYLDQYKEATGDRLGEKGLSHMILDSYEAGHMNWTPDFAEEFQQRRGYDLKNLIPVLTGRVVESVEKSEKFLWDFRKTIGEMIATNHYDVIGEELHKRNMKRYTESHENKRIYLADGMDVKRNADIPMAAMWTPGSLAEGAKEEVRSEADIRESASVANIYGKSFVAAESMTAIGRPFQDYPEKLKRTADMELASGLNRFVIHASVHQPLDDKMPGFSLGPFGQYFTRQETWANQAKPWMDYLARSSYLLQQGENVADVLYYYGENNNITQAFNQALPDVPHGYEFDFVNATALIEAIAFKNGKLTAQSGNTYEVLYLDKTAENMTLPVLKKLQKLVQAGAKVGGTKPKQSPSLSDDQNEFEKIANDIWSSSNIIKGSVGEVLQSLNIAKDVEVKNTSHEILYRHRRTKIQNPKSEITHIYWLNNRNLKPTSADLSFRISDKTPKLWNPQTGEVSDVSYTIKNGRTLVSVEMQSWDAFFIVFIDQATSDTFQLPELSKKEVLAISTPWEVTFQKERGAPEKATFETLQSWAEREETGIKYFSGTASYKTDFEIPEILENVDYELDLGEVKNIAEVFVNGQSIGTLWKTPFTIDLKNNLKQGKNTLEIKVTNLWVNRLIGDAQPDVKEKITFTTMPFYRGQEPLQPSGLLGKVVINQKNKINLKD